MSQISEELLQQINEKHAEVVQAKKRGLEAAKKAGELLLEAKRLVKENSQGRWLSWLKEHCPNISERTARNYMAIAEYWEEGLAEKSETVADFGVSDAINWMRQVRREQRNAEASNQPSDSKRQSPATNSNSELTDIINKVRQFSDQIEGLEIDSISDHVAQNLVEILAIVETQTVRLRNDLAEKLVAESENCCPNCNTQLSAYLLSCPSCQWNSGRIE